MWAGDMEKCQSNTDIQDISTKQRYDIHVPNTNHSIKKRIYSTGIDLFNNLPPTTVSSNHITNVFMPAHK